MKNRTSNRKSRSVVLRSFKCPGCGLKMVAPKGNGSESGHIKDMYCPMCKEDQKFVMFDSDRVFCR